MHIYNNVLYNDNKAIGILVLIITIAMEQDMMYIGIQCQ